MNKSKVVVADTKEAFTKAVDKALAQGYLPTEEYAMNGTYYIGKFTKDKDSESSISIEAAMKALEQPVIEVVRSSAKNTPSSPRTRKRKV